MTLNELEPSMERLLAPTDCRLRPDIRAMENGDIGNTNHTFMLVDSTIVPPHTSPHTILQWLLHSLLLCFTDTASTEKERLEEKQRAARRERSKDEDEWSTRSVFVWLYEKTNVQLCMLYFQITD